MRASEILLPSLAAVAGLAGSIAGAGVVSHRLGRRKERVDG